MRTTTSNTSRARHRLTVDPGFSLCCHPKITATQDIFFKRHVIINIQHVKNTFNESASFHCRFVCNDPVDHIIDMVMLQILDKKKRKTKIALHNYVLKSTLNSSAKKNISRGKMYE